MTIKTRYRPQELEALPFPPGRLSKQAFDDGAGTLPDVAGAQGDAGAQPGASG